MFFFNDTATTEIYTLSLHDALPIFICRYRCATERTAPSGSPRPGGSATLLWPIRTRTASATRLPRWSVPSTSSRNGCRNARSEEHTSELQSCQYLVCRLLLEKKKLN